MWSHLQVLYNCVWREHITAWKWVNSILAVPFLTLNENGLWTSTCTYHVCLFTMLAHLIDPCMQVHPHLQCSGMGGAEWVQGGAAAPINTPVNPSLSIVDTSSSHHKSPEQNTNHHFFSLHVVVKPSILTQCTQRVQKTTMQSYM